MDQNGASNGEETKPEGSTPASGSGKGAGTSTKKRRKVNHGTSSRSSQLRGKCPSETVATIADLGTCSCSLCILSTICKYCIGSKYKGGSLVDAPTRKMFGSS